MRKEEKGPYDDIIDLPHHRSDHHPHMPMEERAAQFSPFAALAGYEEVIDASARQVENRFEPERVQEDWC